MGDLWTGLACLKPDPHIKKSRLFEGKGAYVNVVAWAESKPAFEEKIKRHVEGMNCILVELESIVLLDSRMATQNFPEELITMRETANRQREDSVFGTFNIWHREDSN
ncbi:MAG TPA: hypothetical protein VMX38_18380 [Verrucomicrobiae bacterium]|nr:hypothetical protein [Verrucomicrobiae bacterium]